MSWLFSQALVEEYLGANSSDGEQSAPLNGNPTQLAYLPPDRMTAFSRLSRFGMMFRPLTDDRGEELLALFREASLARTYRQQEREQELKEADQECGSTWLELSMRYDRDLHSWRTHLCLWDEALQWSSVTLPKWGMTVSGVLFQHPTAERPISATGSGLWLTPRATDVGKGESNHTFLERMGDRTDNCAQSLAAQVNNPKTWPTPTCNMVSGGANHNSPQVLMGNHGINLAGAVQKFPTPTAHNAKETNAPSEALRNEPTLASRVGGHLNPDWVEWLMNWPITWSNLNAINPKEFQRWKETSAAAIQEFSELRTMWWDKDPAQASSRQQSGEQREQERGCTLQQVSRVSTRQPEMEGSYEGSGLPLLRNGIHLQAGQRENVQQGMREQACVDETQIVPRVASGVTARVDRLKAIGNGQVPIVAATAFRILSGAAVK